MAVFTAIAAAITGAVTGVGFAAAFAAAGTFSALGIATSVLAAGIGIATARATGMFKAPSIGQADDPGVRITLAPDTANKLPVLYGKAFTSGPVFDAAISNSNETMTYCIALSEETDSGSFSVSNVYLGDSRLVFSGNTCVSHFDPNGTSDTSYNANVRVNVYQGGSTASDIIFPTSGTGSTTPATTIVPHWNVSTHTANSLVFAVVQIDYSPENGLTGLPAITFEMENSLKNPGLVLQDYLNNDRYGVGFANTIIDTTSIIGTASTQMRGFCDDLVAYKDSGGVSQTNKRYEINGVVTTFSDVRSNIDKICMAGGTYFAYDGKQGKFKAIPNRAYTTAEKANALVYSDDNMIGKLDISSTELFSMFNGVEVEFADDNRKDLMNTILIETPAGDRNPNEPDNVLKYGIDLINDKVRAERLANIDLQQSRLSTVIQFSTDYSGMQTDVGDIIKVDNSLYGFSNKLFKVMRTKEVETVEGMIGVEMTCLEYDDDIYTIPANAQYDLPRANIDLPRIPVYNPGSFVLPSALSSDYGNLSIDADRFGTVVFREHMANLSTGGQIEDKPANKLDLDGTTNYTDLFTTRELDFTAGTGLEPGDYSFMSGVTPIGAANANVASYSLIANVNITYANTTTQNEQFGISMLDLDYTPSTIEANKKITIGPDPVSGNVTLEGFNTLDQVGGDRGFNSIRYDMLRLNKGDVF